MKKKPQGTTPDARATTLEHRRCAKMARSAHAYVRGNTLQFYEWVRPESRPDDCPAWSRDRTCRPIGNTLGGQAER